MTGRAGNGPAAWSAGHPKKYLFHPTGRPLLGRCGTCAHMAQPVPHRGGAKECAAQDHRPDVLLSWPACDLYQPRGAT